MGIKEVAASAYSAVAAQLPILRMVQNDTQTYIVQFNIDRYTGGVDLSGMTWRVNLRNAAGDKEPQDCTVVGDSGETVVVQWLVKGIATAAVGNTEFQLEGKGSDGRIWQSDIYFNEVGESMHIDPAYTPAICGAGLCGNIVCGKE